MTLNVPSLVPVGSYPTISAKGELLKLLQGRYPCARATMVKDARRVTSSSQSTMAQSHRRPLSYSDRPPGREDTRGAKYSEYYCLILLSGMATCARAERAEIKIES